MAEVSKEKKPNIISKITKYFREVKAELKKVVWPTPKQTAKNTLIVLASIAVIGVIIWGFDTGFSVLANLIFSAGTGTVGG